MVIFLPSERNKETYLEALREYNWLSHEHAKYVLHDNFPDLRDPKSRFAIVTTGSDGRNEKSPLSPIELILLHEGADNVEKVIEKLSEITKKEEIFDCEIEIKDLRHDLVSIYGNDEQRVFPTRSLDSLHLIGNEFLHENYRLGVVDELKGTQGKKRLKRFSNQKRYHRQILQNKRKDTSFELNTGILTYDGNRKKSTKYTHLRPVQYTIGFDILKAIKNGQLNRNFIQNFSTRTTNRLNNLYYRNMLDMSATELDDVTAAYNSSLYWYHLSEEKFLHQGEKELAVDSGELKEVSQIILDFATRKKSILKF